MTSQQMLTEISQLATKVNMEQDWPCTGSHKDGSCITPKFEEYNPWPPSDERLCASCAVYWHLCEAQNQVVRAIKIGLWK